MLTSRDAREDMKNHIEIEKSENESYFRKGVFIGIRLIIKLLLGMRVNETMMLEKLGIAKVVPTQRKQNEETVE